MTKTCENCQFHSSHRDGWNICQRRAPQAIHTEEDGIVTIWPETNLSDYCGEWQEIEDQREYDREAAALERIEYLSKVNSAASKLARECSYLQGANSLGDYDPPQVSMDAAVVIDILAALEDYHSASRQQKGQPK